MANKSNLRFAKVESELKTHCSAVLNSIDAANIFANQLIDAQSGEQTRVWARTLFGTASTGRVTLTVDATAHTVSCIAGAGLFANFRVGREVQLITFTNGGNNQATEITAVSADMITVANATGLVDETDTSAKALENATPDEEEVVDMIVATAARFGELKDAIDNVAVVTEDRRDDLTDWIW